MSMHPCGVNSFKTLRLRVYSVCSMDRGPRLVGSSSLNFGPCRAGATLNLAQSAETTHPSGVLILFVKYVKVKTNAVAVWSYLAAEARHKGVNNLSNIATPSP